MPWVIKKRVRRPYAEPAFVFQLDATIIPDELHHSIQTLTVLCSLKTESQPTRVKSCWRSS